MPMPAPLWVTDGGGGAEGCEAGVPRGGDSVAIVFSSIHMCCGESLWWLRIDYEVVLFEWNDYSMVSQASWSAMIIHGSC
jgi:hypothetical protein